MVPTVGAEFSSQGLVTPGPDLRRHIGGVGGLTISQYVSARFETGILLTTFCDYNYSQYDHT
jgi:hypothetical protein